MTFMLLIDMDVNRFYTAIPPSHIDLAISWNERLCSSKNRLFIGSIWLYMFMYDIYIYCIHIVDSWVLHIRNYSVHGCDVVCGLLMGARISINELNLLGH